MFIGENDPNPQCKGYGDMFFGTEDDGRQEAERDIREAEARAICHVCIYRWRCLEGAMVHRERYGVWGGMGEAERKRFRAHLLMEGYSDRDMPLGIELIAATRAFYRTEERVRALEKAV